MENSGCFKQVLAYPFWCPLKRAWNIQEIYQQHAESFVWRTHALIGVMDDRCSPLAFALKTLEGFQSEHFSLLGLEVPKSHGGGNGFSESGWSGTSLLANRFWRKYHKIAKSREATSLACDHTKLWSNTLTGTWSWWRCSWSRSLFPDSKKLAKHSMMFSF